MGNAAAQCTAPRYLRREFGEITEPQRQAYLRAVNSLKLRPAGAANNYDTWNLDQFVKLHWDLSGLIHGTSSPTCKMLPAKLRNAIGRLCTKSVWVGPARFATRSGVLGRSSE
eukprot:jgi/Hompol1/3786/HPOL_006743-RA